MKQVKGRSSRILQKEFQHLRRRYWGRHFWARGYFCATAGRATDEQIREYIDRHDREPPSEDFTVGE
jgi:putative transposase